MPSCRFSCSARLTPEQFARRLSQYAARLGLDKRVNDKTPYKWCRGSVPRHPWPALTAHLLTDLLGSAISIEDLGWNTVGTADLTCLSADGGLPCPGPWTAPSPPPSESAARSALTYSSCPSPQRH